MKPWLIDVSTVAGYEYRCLECGEAMQDYRDHVCGERVSFSATISALDRRYTNLSNLPSSDSGGRASLKC